MATETKALSHSEAQAVAQVESIRAMVRAADLDWDRLEELRDERDSFPTRDDDEPEDPSVDIISGPDGKTPREHLWAEANPDESEELKNLEEEAGEYDDAEAAETAIQEDPLSVQVRSGWVNPGEEMTPEEFEILLCTGGPACRIVGDLDDSGEPHSCQIEHQDWGTPWTEHFPGSAALADLLSYCRRFVFAG